jgi:hypothetical protein
MSGKRINRNLIRKYFGSGARITGFGGHYRVTTDTGGEVIISPNKIRTVFGGEDVYRAVALLSREKWGNKGVKVRGSQEFMLGAMLHGEANGLKVRSDHSSRSAAFFRGLVCIGIIAGGLKLCDPQNGGEILLTVGLAFVVFAAMKRSARREEQRKAEALGFHYPRTEGSAGAASTDDLERGGWL